MESLALRNKTGLTHPNTNDHVSKVETHSRIKSRLFINSSDRLTNTGYDNAQFQSGSSIIKTPISKIGFESYKIDISYPNVNSRNKVITFFSAASGLQHTVTLDEAYYTSADLINEIQTQLNSVSGASLISFTFTPIPGSLNAYELVATGNYRFLPSTHIDRAEPLSGLFATPTDIPALQPVFIVAKGFYTRFIDVVIDSLKDGIHVENTFSADNTISNTGHVYRIPVTEYTDAGLNKLFVSKDVLLPVIQYSSFRTKKLDQITVQLFDEFNDRLYSPDNPVPGTVQNIKYVDYLFTFSLE